MQGNPLNEKDLRRASIVKASAIIVLTHKHVMDPKTSDHRNILTAIAMKKYVYNNANGKNVRLCLQLIKPESKKHYYSSLQIQKKEQDQLIVIEELKMNLLAKSCFCPGIISLLGNLIKSAGDQDLDAIDLEWMKEYLNGMGHEIYRVQLSSKFEGKKFSEFADVIYKDLQAICFGLELKLEGQTLVLLNPGNYEIKDTFEYNIHVYVICEDKSVADEVSTYELNAEQIIQTNQRNAIIKEQEAKDFENPEDDRTEIKRFIDNPQDSENQDETEDLAFTSED